MFTFLSLSGLSETGRRWYFFFFFERTGTCMAVGLVALAFRQRSGAPGQTSSAHFMLCSSASSTNWSSGAPSLKAKGRVSCSTAHAGLSVATGGRGHIQWNSPWIEPDRLWCAGCRFAERAWPGKVTFTMSCFVVSSPRIEALWLCTSSFGPCHFWQKLWMCGHGAPF